MESAKSRILSTHQLGQRAALAYALLGALLLLVTDPAPRTLASEGTAGLFGTDLNPWIYLLVTTLGVYWLARLFFRGLLRNGTVMVLETQRSSKELVHYLERLNYTTDAILQSSTQGIFGMDPKGIVTFINPAMCDMLGFTEAELLGSSHHEMVHHHHADGRPYPLEECPLFQSLKTGQSCRGEEIYIRKDGALLPVEYNCNPLCENGKPIGAVVFFVDISTRRQTEQQLYLSSMVVESLLEGLIVTDPQGTIISVNPAFTQITGFSEEEAIGKSPHILKSNRQGNAFYEAMWQSIVETGRWCGEIYNRHSNGNIYPEWLNITRVCNNAGETSHYIGTFTDISELKAAQEELRHLAHHDPLTGLPNRLLFNDRLNQSIKRAYREDCQVAILFVDLDHFKHINDSQGHAVGDEILCQVSSRLKGLLREGDTVARLGGDEFIVLVDRLDGPGDAALVARKLETAFETPFQVAGQELFAGASIGISLYPQDGLDADTLVRQADASMYQAKGHRR